MPEDLNDEDFDQAPEGFRKHMRNLEKRLKAQEDELARLKPLERETVFLRAGIDPDDKRARYFVKGYDGELSAEAVKAAAAEAGFLAAPSQEQAEPDPREAEMAAMQRAGQAATGAQPNGLERQLTDRIYAATSAEQVLDELRKSGRPPMTDIGY